MQAVALSVFGADYALRLYRPPLAHRLVDEEDEWLADADETARRELLMEVSESMSTQPPTPEYPALMCSMLSE